MPGVTLAEGSVVGSNSVLTKDTEPWTIYVGNPAKPIKIRDNETILQYAKELGYAK
jgi:dTDP-4-amino-4,6-dideoxy-D-glucose acyltransferase